MFKIPHNYFFLKSRPSVTVNLTSISDNKNYSDGIYHYLNIFHSGGIKIRKHDRLRYNRFDLKGRVIERNHYMSSASAGWFIIKKVKHFMPRCLAS